jgi:hypothetical protein
VCANKYYSIRRKDVWQDMEIFIKQNILLYDVSFVSLARAPRALTAVTATCSGGDVT